MRKRALPIVAVPFIALVGTASAVRSPDYLDERPLETATGGRGRAFRDVAWDRAPDSAKKAWSKFLAATPGTWRSQWDRTTDVPLRIWGEGIYVAGSMANPAIAEQAARALLAQHIALLAPGAKADDFQVVSNVLHGKGDAMRTVGFFQYHDGMRVLGGQLSFLFKKDRVIVIGSEVLPNVLPPAPTRTVSVDAARDAAVAWVDAAYATHTTGGTVGEPLILPIIRDKDDGTQAIEYRVVRTVEVDSSDPRALWDVYVDVASGTALARTQKLRFATGTVKYKVPVRNPSAERMDYPAALANTKIGQTTTATDASGVITWSGTAAATVTTAITGQCTSVASASGTVTPANLTLQPSGSATWDQSTSETSDAALTAFIHVTIVNRYAKANLNPNLAWLDRAVSTRVNESGNCNAYSTGDDIHFYRSSTQCENTGRIADVMYHEFGHSVHNQSIIPGAGEFDGALSEGISDYLAATITNDHGMGRGFFRNQDALRDLDPVGTEKRWPDDRTGEVHDDGEIIAGTLWDLRKGMIAALGAGPGVTKADDIYYAINQRASDIPSTYAEALAADDDDGNLANGTPNQCVIQNVFAAHGLASGDGGVSIGVGHPERDGFTVSVPIEEPPGDCPVADVQSAKVTWKVRGASGAGADVAMTESAASWSGAIPSQTNGTVVQYKVTVTLTDGSTIVYPDNPADPMYEFFVGPVERIYCTDFETDPTGWTHGATTGTDDFTFGTPTGAGDDPTAAFSGTRVFGNDLGSGMGADGTYEPSVDLWAKTQEIDVTGYENVRLQYRRWLGVEDGFFDDATISVDGTQVWGNLDSMMGNNSSTSHKDKEWRFQDVDITAQASDGKVQVQFGIKSDQGLELGGWNIDDFCVVGWSAALASCGDGTVGNGEQCDDGNNVDGDGCSATCVDEPGGPDPDDPNGDPPGGCCSTSKDDAAGAFALSGLLAVVLMRRRRRAA